VGKQTVLRAARGISFFSRCWLVCLALVLCVISIGRASAGNTRDSATSRIVSLVPSITEIAFETGASDQLVGRSDFCRWPAEALKLPSAGGLINPNLEKIISLRPTLVFVYDSETELAGKLSRLGIKTISIRSDSLEDLYECIHQVRDATGQTTSAAILENHIRQGLEQIRQSSLNTTRTRTLIIVSRQTSTLQEIYCAGPATYLGELLEIAGGENLCPGGAHAYPPASKETIIKANPDLIIDTSLGEAGTRPNVIAAHESAWNALPMIRAVQTKSIEYLSDPHLTIPGPSVLQTAKKIRELVSKKAARE
jgi:iron complex transport system substrate-binding protein